MNERITATGKGMPHMTAPLAVYAPSIINSPWARLMMFIIPRITIRPNAMSSRNAALVANW
jgi:hypothetical protein